MSRPSPRSSQPQPKSTPDEKPEMTTGGQFDQGKFFSYVSQSFSESGGRDSMPGEREKAGEHVTKWLDGEYDSSDMSIAQEVPGFSRAEDKSPAASPTARPIHREADDPLAHRSRHPGRFVSFPPYPEKEEGEVDANAGTNVGSPSNKTVVQKVKGYFGYGKDGK